MLDTYCDCLSTEISDFDFECDSQKTHHINMPKEESRKLKELRGGVRALASETRGVFES